MMKKTFGVILLCVSMCGSYGQQASPKLVISHLTGDFYVYTTYSEYQGGKVPANGMYLVTKNGVALFDSPWDTTQFQPLLDSIENRHHQPVVFCIATHFHDDRTAGLEFYRKKGAMTYTTVATDRLSRKTGKKRAQYLLAKDTVFHLADHAFEVYYPGEGHSPDNIIVWFAREKIIYGACLIKSMEDQDLGYLGDANRIAYASTLRNVQKHCPDPAFVIVGHGTWSNIRSLEHSIQMADLLRKAKPKTN